MSVPRSASVADVSRRASPSAIRQATVNRRTELRNLVQKDSQELGRILDTLDAWQILMEHIPHRQLDKTHFVDNGKLKYSCQDVQKIKDAPKDPLNAGELVFEEWGTSTSVRPTLGHLLQLLLELQLYRAADYLAVEVLHEDPPQRPPTGIAARVNIELPLRFGSVAAAATSDASNANLLVGDDEGLGRTADGNMNRAPSKGDPSVVQKVDEHIFDFIRFSQSLRNDRDHDNDIPDDDGFPSVLPQPVCASGQSFVDIPNISMLLQPPDSGDFSSLNMPALSILQLGNREPANPQMPLISMLNVGDSLPMSSRSLQQNPANSPAERIPGETVPALSELECPRSANIPNLTALQTAHTGNANAHLSAQHRTDSEAAIPMISVLLPNTSHASPGSPSDLLPAFSALQPIDSRSQDQSIPALGALL